MPDTELDLYESVEWQINEGQIESRPKAFKERLKLEKELNDEGMEGGTSFSFHVNELNAALHNTAW